MENIGTHKIVRMFSISGIQRTIKKGLTLEQVKEHILDTAQMFGFKEMTGMDKFFQQLDETIKKVEKDLDEGVDI